MTWYAGTTDTRGGRMDFDDLALDHWNEYRAHSVPLRTGFAPSATGRIHTIRGVGDYGYLYTACGRRMKPRGHRAQMFTPEGVARLWHRKCADCAYQKYRDEQGRQHGE